MVFNALSGLSTPPASLESVIKGILMVCGSCYQVDFSHIKKQSNGLVHLLVKQALGIVDFETWMFLKKKKKKNFETWMEDSPCFLEQALIHDVSPLV